MGIPINIAVAYGRSKSVALIQATNGYANSPAFLVESVGDASVESNITNQSFDVISFAVMVGLAYAQGEFTANLVVPETVTLNAKDVTVGVDAVTNANTLITPSALGTDASVLKLAMNLGFAFSRSNAKAFVSGGGVQQRCPSDDSRRGKSHR